MKHERTFIYSLPKNFFEAVAKENLRTFQRKPQYY